MGLGFTSDLTGYYPADTKMEGGSLDAEGNPIYTLDQFRRGEAPYVTVAGDPKMRGAVMTSPKFPGVLFKISDTGGAFQDVGTSRLDIARDDEAGANSPENNTSVPFQLLTGGLGGRQSLPTPMLDTMIKEKSAPQSKVLGDFLPVFHNGLADAILKNVMSQALSDSSIKLGPYGSKNGLVG